MCEAGAGLCRRPPAAGVHEDLALAACAVLRAAQEHLREASMRLWAMPNFSKFTQAVHEPTAECAWQRSLVR